MPEIRKDPVFGRWVIIASERGQRPNEFRAAAGPDGKAHVCPFCAGNEDLTPPAIYSLPAEGGGWRLRVVRNKYPALVSDGSPDSRRSGIYDSMDGMGFHEVVIESPGHDLALEAMPVEAVADVIRTFVLRIREIKKDPRIKYVMVFKNHGRAAGASLLHPHSQIIAMPMVPLRVTQEVEGAAEYNLERGTCVFCDIVAEELAFGRRIVAENDGFLAVTPYASRFSFETWILPKSHASHFEDMAGDMPGRLAEVLKTTLGKLTASIEGLSYNLIVHTMPAQDPASELYHWHIEIMPKLGSVAGFEWGTGFYINAVSPEEAAEILNSGGKYRPV